MPWASLVAFLRIVTNPRIFERPESVAAAWQQVVAWLDVETVWIPEPAERHREVLGSLLRSGSAQANLIPDAHLAALAIEHGLVLCSTDGDFAPVSGTALAKPAAERIGVRYVTFGNVTYLTPN